MKAKRMRRSWDHLIALLEEHLASIVRLLDCVRHHPHVVAIRHTPLLAVISRRRLQIAMQIVIGRQPTAEAGEHPSKIVLCNEALAISVELRKSPIQRIASHHRVPH